MNAFTNMIAVESQGIAKATELFLKAGKLGQQALAFMNGKETAPNARAFLGLSKNNKMPSFTLAIPALETCPRGAKLALIEGSVCFDCYAQKGHDAMAPARNAKSRRLALVKLAIQYKAVTYLWVKAWRIAMAKESYFRWHSAGDIFSMDYAWLMQLALKASPHVTHWIPTRERRHLAGLSQEPNAVIRLSDDMVNQTKRKEAPHVGVQSSGVHTGSTSGFACPAPQQGGACGDCRECWSNAREHVSYHLH